MSHTMHTKVPRGGHSIPQPLDRRNKHQPKRAILQLLPLLTWTMVLEKPHMGICSQRGTGTHIGTDTNIRRGCRPQRCQSRQVHVYTAAAAQRPTCLVPLMKATTRFSLMNCRQGQGAQPGTTGAMSASCQGTSCSSARCSLFLPMAPSGRPAESASLCVTQAAPKSWETLVHFRRTRAGRYSPWVRTWSMADLSSGESPAPGAASGTARTVTLSVCLVYTAAAPPAVQCAPQSQQPPARRQQPPAAPSSHPGSLCGTFWRHKLRCPLAGTPSSRAAPGWQQAGPTHLAPAMLCSWPASAAAAGPLYRLVPASGAAAGGAGCCRVSPGR